MKDKDFTQEKRKKTTYVSATKRREVAIENLTKKIEDKRSQLLEIEAEVSYLNVRLERIKKQVEGDK